MNADQITVQRIADLLVILEIATDSVASLKASCDAGEMSPAETAAEIEEIIANINAAAQ